MCSRSLFTSPEAANLFSYPIIESPPRAVFHGDHNRTPNTRSRHRHVHQRDGRAVPVVSIEQPTIANNTNSIEPDARTTLEAYRQSLDEYLASSDAIYGSESEEDDLLQYLEKLGPQYCKKRELYIWRRVACHGRKERRMGVGREEANREDVRVERETGEGEGRLGDATELEKNGTSDSSRRPALFP
jgi:hypothetical protein